MSDQFRRPTRRRRAIPVVAASAVGLTTLAVGGSAPSANAAPGDETVQILSFNDYHGHVQEDTADPFGDPPTGGGEYLSAKLTELRADAEGSGSPADNTYTVAAGDLIGGSPYFSGLFHDEPSVESLNEMGLDYSGVGNHEFDEGTDELIRMQDGGCHPVDGCYFPSEPYAGASFQWLAANVTEDAPDGTNDFEDSIPDWAIETTADGNSIAFIGMTLDGTPELVAAEGIQGFTFEDEIEAANEAVLAIKAADPTVEAMVLMLHEGGFTETFQIDGCDGISGPIVEIAEGLNPEIDAIVSGHTHQPYTCSIADPDGNQRPVTSAYSYGRVVTEINLELDTVTGEVDRGTFATTNHEVVQTELTADPAVTAVIDKWQPLADEVGTTEVGSITADINRGVTAGGDEDRGVESPAGNLVADAQLAATAELGAQIALMNPGGVRSDLVFAETDGEGDGVVTYGEAFTFQPFNNTMLVLPMTGEQIVSVLEEQCQPSGSSRPILHLGVSEGFTYDLNITLDEGDCTAVEISNVELNGEPLDVAATYQVAVNNFLADGGDNFETFADVPEGDRIPGPQDIDALIDYLEANSPVDPPPTDRVTEVGTTLSSITPSRLLDTRVADAAVTVDGEFQGIGRVGAGETVALTVAGRGGVPLGAGTVELNIAVIKPSDVGFITVFPCGSEQPIAANANYFPGDVVSNAVLAEVGTDGQVCVYSESEIDMTVDANGFVRSDGSPTAAGPARILETRSGDPSNATVDGQFEGDGPIEGGTVLELDVAGRASVTEDAAAVVMNVASINPAGYGFLTIYPCDVDRPQSASVNYEEGDIVSNQVTVGISGDDGTVCIYSDATVDVTVDVNGFVPVNGSPDPITPARLLETRDAPGATTIDGLFEGEGQVAADSEVELQVAGRAGLAADATTAVLNVATVRPEINGFVTVYPCGEDRPNTANVNYAGDDVTSNGVVAKIGENGTVCIYTSAATDVVVDVTAEVPPLNPFTPLDEAPAEEA